MKLLTTLLPTYVITSFEIIAPEHIFNFKINKKGIIRFIKYLKKILSLNKL